MRDRLQTLRRTALTGVSLMGFIAHSGCGSKTGLETPKSVSDAGALDAAVRCDGRLSQPLAPANSQFHFLVDTSASMTLENRWGAASNALGSLFADPKSEGLSVALTFFPAAIPSECQADYASPAVPFGLLSANPAPQDAHEMLLLKAVSEVFPAGTTPTRPALQGVYAYTSGQTAPLGTPGRVVILITDGTPSSCGVGDTQKAIAVTKAARTGPAQIITHVVAIGDGVSVDDMLAIANAGDGRAIFVEANANLDSLLLDAFIATTRTCGFHLGASAGTSLGLETSDGSVTALEQVKDASQCAEVPLAWYLDSQNSALAVLCPVPCELAQGSGSRVVKSCKSE